ncbi:DNA alkylation repair protein [Streptomyces lunaelactis]|uniref:DNA alkylation repair protein n=1 Tax=Streptomyces lunaelactis TaxID=1535768 RepID=UPI001584B1B4|nr:DNA alkylation repair protein [Streptomyces lunaelactis]NUK09548.1 DNA alkylation repair protein [Streptomyces lunaelactis]NUK35224.1 DNA alkylation repair protein [Streptomyces lunaelactis]NUK42283.1 DNA alkylation repair protein [Streptomyces lunaelactis]NUK58461.1 DNA alkylation repair protein [Streptomyces lunaelactis]NUK92760.1 DNA alkylation repair protein [Streptomyces lunaelactis]
MPPAVPHSELAGTVMDRLTTVYPTGADAARAEGAAAYMKDIAPFLGLYTAARRDLSRTVLEGTARPDEADCTAIALRCWDLPEREYQYFAVDYLRRQVKCCSSGFLPVVRHLVVTVPWWDTVDALASHVVGPLVSADPKLKTVMDAWIDDDHLWVVRTALLHQLRYKDTTDAERLFDYCLRRADHPDFFIRKAIGWCLREYARTDPDAVRDFVEGAGDRLSPLSVREATKHL